jgi:hypothetical protein
MQLTFHSNNLQHTTPIYLLGGQSTYSQPKDDPPLNGAKTQEKYCQEQDNAEHCSRIKLIVNLALATPLKEELLKLERATRGLNPTCLHFRFATDAGQAPHPFYFFCSNSDKWVDDYIICENRKKMSRNSKADKCKAQHTSFISPARKIKQQHCWFLNTLDVNEAACD